MQPAYLVDMHSLSTSAHLGSPLEYGLDALLSLDIQTGWNFHDQRSRAQSILLLTQLAIVFVMLCPPCGAFSVLQHLWNFKKLHPSVVAHKVAMGTELVEHAMCCALVQYNGGRFFAFEHPCGAHSWKLDAVQAVRKLPGVICVVFDQCMLGLCSKCTHTPMRKRTRIMTNSLKLAHALMGKTCDKSHEHQTIQGTEGGIRRSVWAQLYPKPFVNLVAQCVYEEV
jgi:hypothetical protein